MGVHIYSVKANSEAANIRVYIMTTQKGQSYKFFTQGSPGVTHFAGKFSRVPRVQEKKRCWGYVPVFQTTAEKLLLKSVFPSKVAASLLSGSKKGTVAV